MDNIAFKFSQLKLNLKNEDRYQRKLRDLFAGNSVQNF